MGLTRREFVSTFQEGAQQGSAHVGALLRRGAERKFQQQQLIEQRQRTRDDAASMLRIIGQEETAEKVLGLPGLSPSFGDVLVQSGIAKVRRAEAETGEESKQAEILKGIRGVYRGKLDMLSGVTNEERAELLDIGKSILSGDGILPELVPIVTAGLDSIMAAPAAERNAVWNMEAAKIDAARDMSETRRQEVRDRQTADRAALDIAEKYDDRIVRFVHDFPEFAKAMKVGIDKKGNVSGAGRMASGFAKLYDARRAGLDFIGAEKFGKLVQAHPAATSALSRILVQRDSALTAAFQATETPDVDLSSADLSVDSAAQLFGFAPTAIPVGPSTRHLRGGAASDIAPTFNEALVRALIQGTAPAQRPRQSLPRFPGSPVRAPRSIAEINADFTLGP